MTPPRVPEPGRAPVARPGGLRLQFVRAFRFDRLRWSRCRGVPRACGYCGGQLVEDRLPIMLLRDDNAIVALCDDCATDALEIVRQ